MTIRPTQASISMQARRSLMLNLAKLVRAQEQTASGKRILRPSDDPVGALQALALRRQVASTERYSGAIQSGRTTLDAASGRLQEAGGLVSEARSLLLRALNGTMGDDERRIVAGEVDLIRDQLLELANGRIGDRFLFGGVETASPPFEEVSAGGRTTVRYAGSTRSQELLVSAGMRFPVDLPGSEVFSRVQRSGTRYAGLTGAAAGTSADQGEGYGYLTVRHESTTGTLGAGIALVAGGANDTLMGDRALAIDGAAGTVQLGAGTAVAIPPAGSPGAADFVVRDEHGAELHLDFTGYTGGDFTGTVTGQGSISIDGATFVPLDFLDGDLELLDSATGRALHVDTRAIHTAGVELVTHEGTVNLFDTLQGIVDDLNNVHGLDSRAIMDRAKLWMDELDRNHENVLSATGTLGSRSQRLSGMESRNQDASLQLTALLSNVEDADLTETVVELTRAEQNLQLAQASSARILQTSLLNFLS